MRTQLQIDEKTYEALREAAHSRRRSMSSVVREILQGYFEGRSADMPVSVEQFTFVGSGASGRHDISEHHDDALLEDFK